MIRDTYRIVAGSSVHAIDPNIEKHYFAKFQAQSRVQDLIGWERGGQEASPSHSYNVACQSLKIVWIKNVI